MRLLFSLLFIIICFLAKGQEYSEYGQDKVRITGQNKTIVAEIYPVNSKLRPKQDLFYWWYSANLIHTTQGGYSGRLLNGEYTEYDGNKNLIQQGVFKKGLKNGEWKSWNEDGSLKNLTHWKDGVIYQQQQKKSLWKKVNIFKRDHIATVDTIVKKPNKK